MQFLNRNQLFHQLRTYSPALILVYALAIYVVLLSLTSLIPALTVRFETGLWLTGGDTNDPLYEFGTSFGFWGSIFFTLGMVLSTRAGILERLFGGLDKVYRVHAFAGKLTLLFIGAHFFIVVLQGFPDAELTREYLIPGINLSYTLGIFGTAFLILLVVLTLWVNIPYHRWLQTHRWMGLPFLAGTAHAIVIQGDWYMWLMTLIGGAAWLHMLFFYERLAPQRTGYIEQIKDHGNIHDITLKLNEPVAVQPGQFVFLSITGSQANLPREQHPFSVSGVQDETTIGLSIKTLGDYTSQLKKLVHGDQVKIFGPYGQFGVPAQSNEHEMIWIAGGIGITPFLSLLEAERSYPQPRPKIRFLWSVKRGEDAVYLDRIHQYLKETSHVEFALHVSDRDGYLSPADMMRIFKIEHLNEMKIFLCGPIPMMHNLTRQLSQSGIPLSNIISEEFALRR